MTADPVAPIFPLLADAILPRMNLTAVPDSDSALRERQYAWIAAMAEGNETALNALYETTLARVFGLALRITGRRDLAEDVVLEVYWQAWRDASRFDANRGEPMAWLMTICRSRALDALRRQDSAESHPEPEILVADEPGADPSPLEALLATEAGSTLGMAIAKLTPVQRQMIALAFFKGLSHQEIADHTGLPLGTVKSHLKRAQDSLKDDLGVTED